MMTSRPTMTPMVLMTSRPTMTRRVMAVTTL